MAVTSKWYSNGLKAVASGSVNWTADTIKVALLDSGYAPNQDADTVWADVSAHEVAAGNGYTAGGATLAGKSINLDAATNVVSLRGSASVWTPGVGETLTGHYLVVYKSTGALLGYIDLGADVSATNADWTSTWDATDGVLKLTAA